MKFLPEEFDEILNIFREESEEIIQKINSNLLHLEKNPTDTQVVTNLFQNAHSLKGAARMMGFFNIQNLSHKIEDLLSLIRDKKIKPEEDVFNVLYKSTDFLMFLISSSVKAKEDYDCDEIQSYIDNLNSIIEKSETKEENSPNSFFKTEEQKEYFFSESQNINALILEFILIIQKYSQNNDNYEFITILKEELKNIEESFKKLDFENINKKIAKIKEFLNQMNEHGLPSEAVETIKHLITEIADEINLIYIASDMNKIDYEALFSENPLKALIEKKEEKFNVDKNILDEINQKILRIYEDKKNISDITEHINVLLSQKLSEEIKKIYIKLNDILEIIKKSENEPQKDIISILVQTADITSKIIIENRNEEGEDLNLILQRLEIVEQMIDISENKDTQLTAPEADPKQLKPEFQKVQDFFKTFEIGTIKTLRVDTSKLDNLISQTGELIINGIKTKKHLSEIEILNNKLDEFNFMYKKTINYIKYYEKKSMNKSDTSENNSLLSKQIFNILQNNTENINDLINTVGRLYKKIYEDDIKLNHIILEIENIVKNIRVLPLATVFHMLPRMVRDIALKAEKEVELLISGSDTSVDKKIIEEIKMPLIHILRNSIDHGIETPEERVKKDKPPVGKIHLSARYEEDKIIIEIEDDGLGINIKKVKEKALEKGLLTQDEIESMTDEQLTSIIFYPGFSTEDTVTEISGRGVGLDIVQTKISQLNGKVKIYSVLNQGAKVIIELPTTMSTLKCFIIGLENQKFAIPMNTIKNVQWIDSDKIFSKDNYNAIIIDNQTIPIIDLAQTLNFPKRHQMPKRLTIAIIESENTKAAFIVDKLHGDQEILHKKLSPPIHKLKNISGITTLISGDLCLIINVNELLKGTFNNLEQINALQTKSIEKLMTPEKNSDFNIMIVDDSKTTLSLLERILLNEGYNIKAFSNPLSAFEKLKYEPFDLIISDVEMPFLNGKELIKQVKNDEMLCFIPVVIVSTLEIKKMREEFKDYKIDAFVYKPEFDRNTFIKTVSTIIRAKKD